MSANFYQTVRGARSYRPLAFIGTVLMAASKGLSTLINKDPQAKQVSTVVVDTAANSTAYTYTVNGVTVTFTSDASATKAEISAGLLAAHNAAGGARGACSAADDGVDTLTLTGVFPGVAFTLADSDANLTTATTTAAAEADAVQFGRAMIADGYVSNEGTRTGIKAASAKLTAQVETLTVLYAAGEKYLVTIEIEGESYTVAVDADTDTNTTAAAINTAINLIMPTASVISTVSTDTVTLTAEVAGKGFKVGVGLEIGTAANLVLAHTTAGLLTDIEKCFAGVSTRSLAIENATADGDDPVYAASAGVEILSEGLIWVANSETISYGDDVYVELGASSTGKFYNSSSATRVKLPQSIARWERDESHGTTDGIALLRVAAA